MWILASGNFVAIVLYNVSLAGEYCSEAAAESCKRLRSRASGLVSSSDRDGNTSVLIGQTRRIPHCQRPARERTIHG